MRITPRATINLDVKFSPRDERGRFEDRIELIFEDLHLNRKFAITRRVRATVAVKADYEALRPNAPYVRPNRKFEEPMQEIIPGIAPPALSAIRWKTRLLQYPIPPGLVETAFGNGTSAEIAARIRQAFLPNTLDSRTHGRHFGVLLWVEEERAR